MPKNLPIEVTKIEDFIMEDEKFNNLNSWVNHVVEDLGNLAYRKSNGTLVTDRANATNLKLTADRKEVLVEDLGYRFEKNGETSRLIGIENRLIGKYKVSMVDEETKIKRKEVLDEFLRYFNTTPITNEHDPLKVKEESQTEEVVLTLDEVIRRGFLIAAIESNERYGNLRLGVGGVIATLINYPVKDIQKKDVDLFKVSLLNQCDLGYGQSHPQSNRCQVPYIFVNWKLPSCNYRVVFEVFHIQGA